ncbi:MAG: NADH-quinone oxidoreductase subunit NuoF [Bacteroidales bacterium]
MTPSFGELLPYIEKREFPNEWLMLMHHEKVSIPTIFISISSATPENIIADIKAEINRYAEVQNIKFNIVETGSFGILSFEPVIGIQLPGKARIYYAEIYSNEIYSLLEAVFSQWVQHHHLLGQLNFQNTEAWEGVPLLKEQKWFCNASRHITEACGFCEPSSLLSAISWNRWTTFLYALRNIKQDVIISIIRESELKGRSGSGFLTGLKWQQLTKTNSEQSFLICNAYESNPSSFHGRLLMESDPHLVLESIAISAYALRSTKAYLVIPYRFSLAIKQIQNALKQAYDNGLLGFDIQKSGYSLDIHIFIAPGSYIIGEETAIINAIEGKKAMPNEKPPYPIQQGLFGKPTVINNVETLTQVTYILRYGTAWFKSIGNEQGYGTKLFSVSGINLLRGVFELPLSVPLKHIYDLTKTENANVKAIHLGGPIGNIFNQSFLENIIINFSKPSFVYDGSILFIDHSNCIVDYIKNEINFIQYESCGKCLPCREGSKQLFHILEMLTKRPENEQTKETLVRIKEVMTLTELSNTISNTSLCGLGKKFPNLINDLLLYFKNEAEEHLYERHCEAGVCKNLRTYTIQVEKCTGCHICYNKCPENAIIGVIQHPHFIIQDKCTSCGICYEMCKFSAITFK